MDVLAGVLTALVGGPGQHDRLLRLHTPLGPEVLVAESLDAHEAVGPSPDGVTGYRLALTALSVDAHIDLAELLGQPVLLELLTDMAGVHRPFHGHVTAFERIGSNGGLARYRLVVEPWLALLRQRVDSFVFQDLTVPEIVESVFADHVEAGGKLVPAWRWNLADASRYRTRSLATQYEESDLTFVERLLADEGLYFWFEHEGAPGDDTLGGHVLVIADHEQAFADGGIVRFHRSDVTERSDSIQQWSASRRMQTSRLQRASWDYRSRGLRPAAAEALAGDAPVTEDIDTSGPYGWPDRATGERLALQQLEVAQVARQTVDGSGSWRAMTVGARFALVQHPGHGADNGDNRFQCLRLRHRARNNLDAEVLAQIEKHLGPATSPALPLPGAFAYMTDGAEEADGAVDFYQNTFDALPAGIAYRPRTRDGHGERLHPKPTVHGTQTAIVVTDGRPVQTDRDHRIKVQFPWQRGSNASNRQPHPSGDDNAPGADMAWTWVRVATAWAGDNWGSVQVPRRGQEVLVAFLEGDVDRPVVIGCLNNGRGHGDAPHNQVAGGAAGATGNAPAWFSGNDHDAAFTGFKSQALGDSQTGSGGYQQLRLDDTPGQGRIQASTTQRDTTLSLGHLKGGRDNLRDGERGFGIELSSAANGALRAGAGLLLSTDHAREQLDAAAAHAQLASTTELVAGLGEVARAQGAELPDEQGGLPAHIALKDLQEALNATGAASAKGCEIDGGSGEVQAWAMPALLASSPDGIVSITPADQVWVAGTHATLAADRDLQWVSQGDTITAVGGGISLYSHGTKPPAGRPNQETGIALHAATGAVSARACANEASIAAKTSVTIASTHADVLLSAPDKHLLLAAGGAYLKLEGGNIELGAPGMIEFKAAKKEWAGAKTASPEALTLVRGQPAFCEFKTRGADASGSGLVPVGD